MKASALMAKILILLIFASMANAGQLYSYQERVIICMLPLEHAERYNKVVKFYLDPISDDSTLQNRTHFELKINAEINNSNNINR